jgi:hypothetical protein
MKWLALISGVLIVLATGATAWGDPVIAGAEEISGDGGPDGGTNILYINELTPFDFSGQGDDHGVLTMVNFWVDSTRTTQGVFTPFVAEPLVADPQTGEDFEIRAIGTTREAGADWKCAGLYSYSFHETEQFVVRNDWVAGFLSSDPEGPREDALSPIPYFPSDVDGWLTYTATPGSGLPAIVQDESIMEGGSGTNVDAYGFRHYQFQIEAEPGDVQPPLPDGGRVDGLCEPIAGQEPITAGGSIDGWTNILYINEQTTFDFSDYGTDEGTLTEFNFWVHIDRELDGMVTPFVVEPLTDEAITGDDFIVRAIGTTRSAENGDWEEEGLHSFPFHDTEEFTVEDGWMAGFMSSDPEGESDLALSPIPFDGSNVAGWLTGTASAQTGAPAIELGEPIFEGSSGTNVDAYGFRRYQFQIVAEAAGGLLGDYDGSGTLDAADLDLQAEEMVKGPEADLRFDLNGDAKVDFADRLMWLHDLKNTWVGDSNLDLEFNSSDMVQVFSRGKYETDEAAVWEEGDWDGNQVFTSGDMVAAFVDGGYESGRWLGEAVAAVPEPSSVLLLVLGIVVWITRVRQ